MIKKIIFKRSELPLLMVAYGVIVAILSVIVNNVMDDPTERIAETIQEEVGVIHHQRPSST